MRTPQDILKEATLNGTRLSQERTLQAMEKYAQQEAEAFAEWCIENNWQKVKNISMWFNTSQNIPDRITKSLYTLFKTEKKG